jgi:plastocyanin
LQKIDIVFYVFVVGILCLNFPPYLASANHFNVISVVSNIQAGDGSRSRPINEFKPSSIETFANTTVKWSNPTTGGPYPHTVTFYSNNSGLFTPTEEFTSNNDSIAPKQLMDLIKSSLLAMNRNISDSLASYLNASVINSTNQDIVFLDPLSNFDHDGAKYILNGTEKYVNSGLLWNPGKDVGTNLPKTFTVTFLHPGTYQYICLLHPHTKGIITVLPAPGPFGIKLK